MPNRIEPLPPGPLSHLIATSVKATATGTTPSAEDLASAVAEVTVESQTLGASLLQVTMNDPNWAILRSGFLNVTADGLLDAIDVNFPQGSDLWWRLAMIDFTNDLSGPNLTLTFQDRIISYLQGKWGGMAVAPGTTTRAQFIKQLVDQVGKGDGLMPIQFVCKSINALIVSGQIDVQVATMPAQAAIAAAKGNKTGAIGIGSNLTVKGQAINKVQAEQANILLGVATQLQAGPIAAWALICAAIGESTLTNLSQDNGAGYWGVLQGGDGQHGSTANFPPPNGWNDSAGMATAFLMGGKGFGNAFTGALQGKGVIQAVQAGITDPGTLATSAEDSGEAPNFYGQWLPEAKAIVNAYGANQLGTGSQASGSPGSVYLLGDSIFAGGASEIQSALQANGWKVNIDGFVGRNTGEGVASLQLKPPALSKASAVVIELGTNASASNGAFATEVSQAVTAIKAANPNVTIYWVNLFSGVAQQVAYNATLATASGITVIDTVSANIALGPDGIHPTPAGDKTLASLISQAVGAGTTTGASAGAGLSTGSTTTDVATLMRGTAGDPDEDSWTCMQRLAADVNWPVFSNGDTIYYDPTTVLIEQQPAVYLSLDETGTTWNATDPNSGDVAADVVLDGLDCTFDNTALTYQETRKVKGKVQRKSRIRKPSTPTQIRLNMVCGIFDYRAGDVFEFRDSGPLTAQWLVVDATRNCLADVHTQFTLAPPTAPNPEPTVTTPASSANTSVTGIGATGPLTGVGGYVNPLSQIKGLIPERIDMGVDYGSPNGGPLLALGNGRIFNTAGAGWPGGTFIGLTLSDGAYAGKHVYYAEHVTAKVTVGQAVKAGDVIGTLEAGSAMLEIGWASGNGDEALAASLNQQASGDPGGWSSAAGWSFNTLLVALGAHSGGGGTTTPAPGHGTMPPGYPPGTGRLTLPTTTVAGTLSAGTVSGVTGTVGTTAGTIGSLGAQGASDAGIGVGAGIEITIPRLFGN